MQYSQGLHGTDETTKKNRKVITNEINDKMMNYKKLALTVAAGAMATTMMAQSAPQLNANNIEEVIKAMTLERKPNS